MKKLRSYRIDEDILEKLSNIAKEERRTVSSLINKVLSDFVNKK